MHCQSYTYQSTSSSTREISKGSSAIGKSSSTLPETLSERTPLIKGTDDHTTMPQGRETAPEQTRPFYQPSESESPHVLTTTVLGATASCTSHGFSTSEISLSLQNSGSVARDHLASERTFLAYVRTSLAIASAGVALAQILTIRELYSDATPARHVPKPEQRIAAIARPLGATAVLIAMLVLFIGVTRYFTIQKALVGGQFPVSRIGIGFMSFLFGGLIIATFGVLFYHRPSGLS